MACQYILKWSRSKAYQLSQFSIMLGLQENGELLQEEETTVLSYLEA